MGRRNVSLCFMRTTHCHFPSDHAPSDNRRQAKLRFNIQPPLICESAETAIGDGCYLVFDEIAERKSSHAFYGSEANTLRIKSNNNDVRGVPQREKTIVYDNRHYQRSCLSVVCSATSKYQTKNLQKAFRIPMKLFAWLQFSNLLHILFFFIFSQAISESPVRTVQWPSGLHGDEKRNRTPNTLPQSKLSWWRWTGGTKYEMFFFLKISI